MAGPKAPVARPLSPHLQIYRPMLTMMMSIVHRQHRPIDLQILTMLTMMMSIVHRITGGALYFGTLLLAWWLIAAAVGPHTYANVAWFMGTLIGQLILFGYTWALIHHALGGVRHLIWDVGYGFGPSEREWLTLAGLIGSIGLTILIWIFGYVMLGGGQ